MYFIDQRVVMWPGNGLSSLARLTVLNVGHMWQSVSLCPWLGSSFVWRGRLWAPPAGSPSPARPSPGEDEHTSREPGFVSSIRDKTVEWPRAEGENGLFSRCLRWLLTLHSKKPSAVSITAKWMNLNPLQIQDKTQLKNKSRGDWQTPVKLQTHPGL